MGLEAISVLCDPKRFSQNVDLVSCKTRGPVRPVEMTVQNKLFPSFCPLVESS